jgi:hypothetical protein
MLRNKEAAVMVDWTMLSPTFLTAAFEWAGAVVTVLAVGPGQQTKQTNGEQR